MEEWETFHYLSFCVFWSLNHEKTSPTQKTKGTSFVLQNFLYSVLSALRKRCLPLTYMHIHTHPQNLPPGNTFSSRTLFRCHFSQEVVPDQPHLHHRMWALFVIPIPSTLWHLSQLMSLCHCLIPVSLTRSATRGWFTSGSPAPS